MIAEADRLIFVHIPKSGGTTLRRLLSEQFCGTGVAHVNRADIQQMPTPCSPSASLVMGHMPFGLHERLPGKSMYLTMLREPTARAISQYHAWLRRRELDIEQFSFDEFLVSTPKLNNDQTRVVLGNVERHVPLTNADLDQAKENLENRFLFAGVTERFDESVILLAQKLGWGKPPRYVPSNQTVRPLTPRDLSPSALRLIRERNELDYALHRHAEVLLEKEIQAVGKAFISQQLRIYQSQKRWKLLSDYGKRVVRHFVPQSLQNMIRDFNGNK